MADDLLDNTPDDDDTSDGIDLEDTTVPADDDDEDTTSGDGDTDAKETKPTKPATAGKTYTQEDVDRIQAATRKERDANATLRRKIREMEKAKTAVDTTDEVAKAREEAAAAEVARFKPIAIRAKAETLLTQRQLQNPTDSRISMLLRNLKLDDIDIDPDDGRIVGLEEQVDDLVDAYPELFTAPKTEEPVKAKPRIPRGDGADRPAKTVDESKLSTADKIARRVLNPGR